MLNAIFISTLGIILIFVEFFLPGGLIALIGGTFVVFGALLFCFQDVSPLLKGVYISGSIAMTFIICKLALLMFKKRKLINSSDQEGFLATEFDSGLIGKSGTAWSDLKPGGHIIVDEVRLPAISDRGYLPKGTEIELIGGKGGCYIVKPYSSSSH